MPIDWPPVPHSVAPLEQWPAVYVKRALAEVRAVKPTEQTLLPTDGFQIMEPARIVQSQAERDVQPASYSVFESPGRSISVTPASLAADSTSGALRRRDGDDEAVVLGLDADVAARALEPSVSLRRADLLGLTLELGEAALDDRGLDVEAELLAGLAGELGDFTVGREHVQDARRRIERRAAEGLLAALAEEAVELLARVLLLGGGGGGLERDLRIGALVRLDPGFDLLAATVIGSRRRSGGRGKRRGREADDGRHRLA